MNFSNINAITFIRLILLTYFILLVYNIRLQRHYCLQLFLNIFSL